MDGSTLAHRLATVVRQNATRTAVVEGDVGTSYAEFGARVASLVQYLQQTGIRPGERVAVMLPNGLGFVTSYVAAVSAGAIVVPLNEHYGETELRYFLDACAVSLLITSQQFEPLCRRVLSPVQHGLQVAYIEDRCAIPSPAGDLEHWLVDTSPDAPLMYQFSSGSTGTPKQIARTHRNLLFELEALVRTLGITTEDRVLGAAPFSHVNGLVRSMMASLYSGATLYPVPRFERRSVAKLIEEERLTVFIAVPFMFSMLAQTPFRRQPDFRSLRLAVSSSAPMPRKHNQQFRERFGLHVRQLYGSTETGTISVNLGPDIEATLDSVGTPLPGVEVEAFTDDGRAASVGEMGEVAVKSPAAITRYEGLDDLNREVFRGGHFFTGDLGKKDERGLLYLVGRKKFFINKAGFKVDPREIEEVLESHRCVQEVVVVGVPTEYGDERVKAVIVPSGPCTEEEIVEHCRGKIADFKVPSVVEFRDQLPRSPTGKVRRAMLLG